MIIQPIHPMAKTSRKKPARIDPHERTRRLRAFGRDCCAFLVGQALGRDVSAWAVGLKLQAEKLKRSGVSDAAIECVIDKAEQEMGPALKKLTGVDVRRQMRLVENLGGGGFCAIPLSRGKHALVSPEDYDKLAKHSWYCGHRGYAMRSKNMSNDRRKTVSMHREILGAGADQEVDHINRNRLDNRRENLRVLGHSANLHNRGAYGSSGVAGVSWDKRKGKWRAEIGRNGKRAWLGYHDTKAAAEREYRLASAKVYTGKDKAGR